MTTEKQVDVYTKALEEAKSALKHIDKKIMKSAGGIPKGAQYDWLNNTSFNNLAYPREKIPDRLLRMVEKRNGIVGSIITLRIQQALEFSHISEEKDIPGWEITLKDSKKSMNSRQRKQKEFLENFIRRGCRDDYVDIMGTLDDFRTIITKYVRDRILIDKITWEIERDKVGKACAIWVLDGATIIPVLPGGWYGSTNRVGTGVSGYSKVSDAIRRAKLAQVPPPEEIAYVQELYYGASGGGIAAAFTMKDLIYDLSNELNEINCYKQGMSVVEKANLAIVAFINSLTFNSNGLSRGAIPKVAIAMGKDSNYSPEQLEDMQDEWTANFEAMDGQWNIPILNSDAKVLPLMQTNRDMEYQKYMEFVGALTCSIMGADSAELGLRLNQAQQVMSENQDAKMIFSKNRGLKDLLAGFTYIINKFLEMSGFDFAEEFKFRFNGLTITDKNYEADLRGKNVKVFKTVNEIRKDNDLPPIDGGDIILDPTYLQNVQAQQQGQEGEGDTGEDQFSDDDINSMVDETMDDMEKAVMLL